VMAHEMLIRYLVEAMIRVKSVSCLLLRPRLSQRRIGLL
jgi:hypothetical protein